MSTPFAAEVVMQLRGRSVWPKAAGRLAVVQSELHNPDIAKPVDKVLAAAVAAGKLTAALVTVAEVVVADWEVGEVVVLVGQVAAVGREVGWVLTTN